MLRKLLLISLIILAPMQSWAALQMPFEHQAGEVNIEVVEAPQHPCHQDVASSSNDEKLSSAQSSSCNACTLCMAFGFFLLDPLISPDRFSMTFKTSDVDFVSHDVLALNKPPIL
jgi:hypothetical protein